MPAWKPERKPNRKFLYVFYDFEWTYDREQLKRLEADKDDDDGEKAFDQFTYAVSFCSLDDNLKTADGKHHFKGLDCAEKFAELISNYSAQNP